MRTVTHGQMTLDNGMRFLTVNSSLNEVCTSFASADGTQNAAHVHMTPNEARKYAQQLIIYANRLDPIE